MVHWAEKPASGVCRSETALKMAGGAVRINEKLCRKETQIYLGLDKNWIPVLGMQANPTPLVRLSDYGLPKVDLVKGRQPLHTLIDYEV